MRTILLSLVSLFLFASHVYAQPAKLPAGAKPLAGPAQTAEGLQPLPYPDQAPPRPVGEPLYQADQVPLQPGVPSDYKSDLPAGWDAPPQVKPGEIPLEDLTGKPWRPVPAGEGNVGDNILVEEEIPVTKKSNKNQQLQQTIEEEDIVEQEQEKTKRSPRRWGQ